MNTEELYQLFLNSEGVTTDSRTAVSGKIFFALRGSNFDGHSFVEQALRDGCSLAVIDNNDYYISGKTFYVSDVLTSLQQLARYHRQQFGIPVIAITGSNGKTTTKELMHAVLSSGYNTLATSGNFNNHIGVPLTLLKLNGYNQIAIIEMGASHSGEIEMLCEIALPTHGLITNIGSAHLEGFGSIEGVLKAKRELFVYLKKTGGTVFLNSDRHNLKRLAEELGLNCITYGTEGGRFVAGILINSGDMIELEIRLENQGQTIFLKTLLTGFYNIENILAAVCAGIYFGISSLQVKKAIEEYIPGNNRSQIYQTAHNKLLMDAYNANPDSMQAAIENFFSMSGNNKSVILGEMLELGKYESAEHIKIVELLKKQKCLNVMLVGESFYNIPAPGNYFRFKNVDELIDWLRENPLRDSFILLKGSRGVAIEKCINAL